MHVLKLVYDHENGPVHATPAGGGGHQSSACPYRRPLDTPADVEGRCRASNGSPR